MMNAPIWHPIIGDGYYPLNDEELEIELAGAEIIEENPMFEAFTLIVGYRDKGFSAERKTAEPFVCIKSHLPNGPHLFMSREAGQ
jgi:hypothetical protein